MYGQVIINKEDLIHKVIHGKTDNFQKDPAHKLSRVSPPDLSIPQRVIFAMMLMIFFCLAWSPPLFAQDRQIARKFTQMAETALENRNVDDALRYLDTALNADPKYAPAFALQGKAYIMLKRYDTAIEKLNRAISLNSGNPNYHLRIGQAYQESGNHKKALEHLLIVHDQAPDITRLYYLLGVSYNSNKKPEKAIENYLKFLGMMKKDTSWKTSKDRELKNEYWKANRSLAQLYSEQKDYKNAMVYYEAIMEGADENFRRSIRKDYEIAARHRSPLYTYAIYILGFILAMVVFYMIRRYLILPQLKRAQDKELAAAAQARDFESLSRFVLKHLKGLTRLPKALIYFAEREGDPLRLVQSVNIDKKSFMHLNLSWDESKDWIEYNQGHPFIYEDEKKEIPFVRAFPGIREYLDNAGPRVGVPFICGGEIRGLALMCYPGLIDEGEKKKLQRTFLSHQDLIRKIGIEVGLAADTIFRRQVAIKDTITNAYSQLYFKEKLPEEVRNCKNKKRPLSLLMMECDGLGAIHKRFSEEGRNTVLRVVYQILEKNVRKALDLQFRISDYRFAIVMPGLDEEPAREIGEIIRNLVATTDFTAPIPNITLSMGLAVFPRDGEKASELEDKVRLALDRAISTGRNKLLTPSDVKPDKSPSLDLSMGPLTQHLVLPPQADTKLFSQPSVPLAPPPDSEKPKKSVDLPGLKFRSASIKMSHGKASESQEKSPSILTPGKTTDSPARHTSSREVVKVTPSREKGKQISTPWSRPREIESIQPEAKGRKRSLRKKKNLGNVPNTSKLPSLSRLMGKPTINKGVLQRGDEHKSNPTLPRKDAKGSSSRIADLKSLAQTARKKMKQQEEKQKKNESKDPVTGFYTKDYFDSKIVALLKMSHQSGKPLTLIFFKLDKHRALKENYGQDKLDNVLKEVCTMISSFLNQDTDVPTRYNNEIFSAIMPDTQVQVGFNVAEQIRFTVENLIFRDIPGQITISMGLSSFPEKGKSPREIMKESYEAMVHAIRSGGNRSVIWEENLKNKKATGKKTG